jgi:hypothetical protein
MQEPIDDDAFLERLSILAGVLIQKIVAVALEAGIDC